MKKNIFTVFLLLLCFQIAGCSNDSNATSPPLGTKFSLLKSGNILLSGFNTSKQIKIINNQDDLEKEFIFYTGESAPNVDFQSGQVLLIDMGKKGDSRYSIKLGGNLQKTITNSVGEKYTYLQVNVLSEGGLYELEPDCGFLGIISNPFAFYYIATNLEILVNEIYSVASCGS